MITRYLGKCGSARFVCDGYQITTCNMFLLFLIPQKYKVITVSIGTDRP